MQLLKLKSNQIVNQTKFNPKQTNVIILSMIKTLEEKCVETHENTSKSALELTKPHQIGFVEFRVSNVEFCRILRWIAFLC